MSSENKNITNMSNGTGNHPNGNAKDTSNGSVEGRFDQSPAADEPYFAHMRMQDRPEHVSRLSNQINKADEILKT